MDSTKESTKNFKKIMLDSKLDSELDSELDSKLDSKLDSELDSKLDTSLEGNIDEPENNSELAIKKFITKHAIHKEDYKLVSLAKIYNTCKKYIDNYYSEVYQKYLNILNVIPKKFPKVKYDVQLKKK